MAMSFETTTASLITFLGGAAGKKAICDARQEEDEGEGEDERGDEYEGGDEDEDNCLIVICCTCS